VFLYSVAGAPQRARTMYQAWDKIPHDGPTSANTRRALLGHLAVAERRYDDALREYRSTIDGRGVCIICDYVPIAFVYDRAQNADSAMAILSRYTDGIERPLTVDADFLAFSLRRLAELHDARGDVPKALSYYARFVELWKDADPDLQLQVRKARARMVELQRRQG
jgi:tetratricopeptide (TPR) repeat protein